MCVGPVRKPHCWFSHEADQMMILVCTTSLPNCAKIYASYMTVSTKLLSPQIPPEPLEPALINLVNSTSNFLLVIISLQFIPEITIFYRPFHSVVIVSHPSNICDFICTSPWRENLHGNFLQALLQTAYDIQGRKQSILF